MAFQYQYQYQYQYGYQVQPGYQPYMSFYQMLHDVPMALSLLSLAVVAIPFIFYFLWRRGYLPVIYFPLRTGMTQLLRKRSEAELEGRVKEEYSLLAGKEKGMGDLISPSGTLASGLIILLVLKKMLFMALILTESMTPVLNPSDLVLIEAISKDVEVGDIVMFQPPLEPNPIIHRVIGVGDGHVTTKGDASLLEDDWKTPIDSILGKAVIISGKPVVVKNFGNYFMPQRIYIPGSDPTLEFVQDSVKYVHEYGPLILVVLILFALVTGFEGKRYGRVYET